MTPSTSPTSPETGVRRRYLVGYVALQLAGAVLFLLTPSETVRATLLAAVPGLAAAAVVLGASRYRPVRASAWLGLAASQGLLALGWGAMHVLPRGSTTDVVSVPGNVVFVLAHLAAAAGVVGLVGLRRRGDRFATLDAAMVSVGLGVLVWVLIVPSTSAAGEKPLMSGALLTYLATDVLLLALTARIILAGLGGPRVWLLGAWVAAQAIADTAYALGVMQGSVRLDRAVFVLWLLGSAMLGLSGLLPARVLVRRRGRWLRAVTPVVIAVAVAPLPLLLLVRAAQGSSQDVVLVAAASGLMAGIAVVRLLVTAPDASRGTRGVVRWSAARFVAGFLVLALLPVAGMAYVAVHESEATMRTEVRDRMEVTASVSSQYVAEQMRVLETLVSSYADRPSLVAALQSPGGLDAAVIDRLMSALQSAHPDLSSALLLDPAGTLLWIHPSSPAVVGHSFAHRDYFRGARLGDRAYVSAAYTRTTPPHERVIGVSRAVRDDDGRVLAVLAVSYRHDAIREFSQRLADVQGVRLTITDRTGQLLAGEGSDVAGLPVSDDARVASALAGRSGTVDGPGLGGPAVSAYRAVPELGWAVVAEVSDDDAFAGQRRQGARVVAVAVLLGQMLLAGMVVAVRAHNRRREVEASLAEREEHLRGILDAAGDAFISMDASGRVTAWNTQAVTIFGYPRETALGGDVVELIVPPEARPGHRAGVARVLAGEAPRLLGQRFEVEAMHATGHRFPAEITLWASTRSGAPSFNAFVRDVTERRRQEEELASTRDLALDASRLKSEFVANMSHEIRTPMNGVLGMTSLLRDTALDPVQRDYADTIESSAEALLRVIDDILDFSKIEAGRVDIEAIDFELRPLVEDVASLLSPAAHGRGVELVVLVDPAVPGALRGDPHRLRQVLTNLVGNAVKYTAQGEVVVTVEPARTTRWGVRVSVRDTGIGIGPEQQARLFEPFQQADASTTRRYGGTGLGLTISRQLVELMGGALEVTSELGRGSTFSFELPLPTASSLPTHSPVPCDVADTRVLVVDDNATNRKLLHQLLTSWSLRPTCSSDAAAALAELRRAARAGYPYELVLLDMHMPGTNGLELAAQVRADADLAATPLAMLTSNSDTAERTAARAVGVRAYLAKPIREVPLYECLVDILVGGDRDPRRPDDAGPPRPSAGRVLIAEDNVVNQRVMVGTLAALGYEADVARDGQDAVEMVARGGYDVVLMDCQMPRMDGFAATRAIRASGQLQLPIVAVSASALDKDRERCLAAGMDDFLSKPLRRDTLAEALTRWVTAAADGAPSAPAAPGVRTGARAAASAPETVVDPVLDPVRLDDLLDDLGAAFFAKLVTTFTETAAVRVAGLDAAVRAGDTAEAARLAHSLTGSSGTLAAHRLSALTAQAELVALRGDEVPDDLLGDIQRELDRAVEALAAAAG